jgi:hypothetical protein
MVNWVIDTPQAAGGQPLLDVATTARHPLGMLVDGHDADSTSTAGEFIYVECSNSITQYDAVAIKPGYKIAPLTVTNAKLAVEIGFSQVAYSTKNTFGWAMKGGRPVVRLAIATQLDTPLFASASGGVLTGLSTSVVLQGIQAATTVTNSANPATCVARYVTAHHEPPG